MKLKQMIKNECEKDNQLAARLAKLAGYEKVNGFYKFVNTPEKEMENIEGLINIVKSLFPDNEKQLLSEYFLELDPNKKCARQSVEYADINQWDDLTDEIIINLCNSKNSTSQEWGKVYSIHRKLNKRELSLTEAIRETGKCKIKTPEMLFFSNAMLMYGYLSIGEFGLMKSTSKLLDFDELPQGYIKDLYASRVSLLKANISFNENNLQEAREYCLDAIKKNSIDRICFFAYLTIGNSLIFESYDRAKHSYIKGKQYAKSSVQEEMMDGALCFLANFWKKENKWVNFTSQDTKYLQLKAYYFINQEELMKAKTILDDLSKREQDDNELGFYFYYRGLLSLDKSDFYKSIAHFKKSEDKYSLQLPLVQLEKLGADIDLLSLISL
ncbi:AimR family lysis-lysogeny pheromone receptor [Bacillus inaquosorum]|uniref:AimR family lysis-lysogeny pheromone receptor n=1 Tax=Bacillus inaquosorum TaxID=483913 RepID=UPI0022820C48|nr:AimR family lysis-lysogeny pheromone receptor [Bacillus inaquosorum]MCY7768112.1 AimR family lysis-lysogeny pheromone receptor [Bacillus inaquosorum]MCY9099522.1 AimR family lysis-lysogeny pheromone receptor [Bacillus inaquosorum]